MAKNTAPQAGATIRRLKVEKMYLLGFPPRKIWDALGDSLDCSFETIKKDVVKVRAAWKEHLEELHMGEAGTDYLQMALSDRRAALKKNDIKTAYAIARDLALMCGVKFTEHRVVEQGGTIDIHWKPPIGADDDS